MDRYRDTELSDDVLLSRFRKEGDNRWLGLLLERYTALLFGVAMKYLKDRDMAADAVQQIFLKTLTSLPDEPILNFRGWIYILMRNHCIQTLKERQRLTMNLPPELMPAAAEDNNRQPAYTPAQLEIALQQLKPHQHQVLRLFYLEEQSYQQIMEKTGYSFLQVKSYIQNGKRNLKQILLQQYAGRP